MSSRALRRLRVEAASIPADDTEDNAESESSSDDDEDRGGGGGGGFMAMLEEESSSEEEESESSDDDSEEPKHPSEAASAAAAVSNKSSKKRQNDDNDEEEEDLDAILNEMKIQTNSTYDDKADESNTDLCNTTTLRSILLSRKHGYDLQDLDLDYSLRSLLGGNDNPLHIDNDDLQLQQQHQNQRGRNNRGNRGGARNNRRMVTKKYLFGKPKIEWGKPPSFVGGGLGVKELSQEEEEEKDTSWSIPWPYNTINEKDNGDDSVVVDDEEVGEEKFQQKWFTFQMSDTYTETNQKYEILMDGQMGDPNTLAMFVADNPFFAETILQMAMVLYYVNDRGRGSDLLRRSMFIYESALPSSLLPSNNDNTSGEGSEIFMDYERKPNAGFFSTLFRIMQTSGMSGCHPNALAVGRYLLSLDPLRDPMGVLLILDYYALASRRSVIDEDDGEEGAEVGAAFIVDSVESEKITIHYKDPLTSRHHKCPLLQMPNWAYAYALALNRLSRSDEADAALIDAMERFPQVLPKLLEMNKVNVQGRSFQQDWPKVLPAFNCDLNPPINDETIEARVTRAAGEHLVRIFVERNHKLWKEDDVLMWMYKCSEKLVAKVAEPKLVNEDSAMEGSSSTATDDVPSKKLKYTFSPALARYAQSDPSDYEDSFRTFPPEAIALDPNLVGPALVHDHRRGRFLRGGRGRGGGMMNRDEMEAVPADLVEQLRGMLGMAGGADNELLDPDSPLLQLYLQALLPWNQVDGVRPPR